MHDREDVGVEEVFVHPVGNALVAKADVGSKRMRDLVLPAATEVVAHSF